MTKSEWGVKRKCVGCGNFFYDMKKKEFTCPKCGASYNVDDFADIHARALLNGTKKETAKLTDDDIVAAVVTDAFGVTEDVPVDILEDAAELGDDNHDMAEVVDNVGIGDEEEP